MLEPQAKHFPVNELPQKDSHTWKRKVAGIRRRCGTEEACLGTGCAEGRGGGGDGELKNCVKVLASISPIRRSASGLSVIFSRETARKKEKEGEESSEKFSKVQKSSEKLRR